MQVEPHTMSPDAQSVERVKRLLRGVKPRLRLVEAVARVRMGRRARTRILMVDLLVVGRGEFGLLVV
jgi:hypothetical protein